MADNTPIQHTSSWLPTLSTRGWVTGIFEKVDTIFSYYFTSQYSQTVHHHGHVKSFQYTVKQFFSDPTALSDAIKVDIISLFEDYVDYVDADVTYKQRDEGPKYDYTIALTIIHGRYRWQDFKTYRVEEGTFEEIVNINNTGGGSLV